MNAWSISQGLVNADSFISLNNINNPNMFQFWYLSTYQHLNSKYSHRSSSLTHSIVNYDKDYVYYVECFSTVHFRTTTKSSLKSPFKLLPRLIYPLVYINLFCLTFHPQRRKHCLAVMFPTNSQHFFIQGTKLITLHWRSSHNHNAMICATGPFHKYYHPLKSFHRRKAT